MGLSKTDEVRELLTECDHFKDNGHLACRTEILAIVQQLEAIVNVVTNELDCEPTVEAVSDAFLQAGMNHTQLHLQLEQERDEARRVLAEFEHEKTFMADGSGLFECLSCDAKAEALPVEHDPDCEWLAAMGKVTP